MKRVFLSFAEEDCPKVKKLLPLLADQDFNLDFYDGPYTEDLQSQEAAQIKRRIGEKIVSSNLTVCLITENTHKSRWVDCQLTKSRNKGNKIIAMALEGTEYAALPQVIKEENLTFYPWSPKKLAEIINPG